MNEVSVDPVREKPARSRRDGVSRQISDPPEALPADRNATFRHGIRSRAALRMLIGGSGTRPTGRCGEQFRSSSPIDSTSREGWVDSL